jgi:hypothetical protein
VAAEGQRGGIRLHTSAYVASLMQAGVISWAHLGDMTRARSLLSQVSIRQHTSAYVSIRRHTTACVSIRQHTSAYVQHTFSTAFSIRQHTSAYVSIRQHTSEYVSIRQHTCHDACAPPLVAGCASSMRLRHTSAYVSKRVRVLSVCRKRLRESASA